MKSFWKIAAPVTCVAVICGAALWPVYKRKAIERKLAESAREYRVGAEQGNAKAQYRLGVSYAEGKGVPRDYIEALRWYRKAADQGDAKAQCGLGASYALGQGVSQDYAEALRWYRKAADQGEAFAQCDLGFTYYHGQEVLQDYVQAHVWMSLAASRTSGDQDHDCARGLDLVAKKMTAEQIAQAERLAREWKPRKQPTAESERDSRR